MNIVKVTVLNIIVMSRKEQMTHKVQTQILPIKNSKEKMFAVIVIKEMNLLKTCH